jgi:hypothetical protein
MIWQYFLLLVAGAGVATYVALTRRVDARLASLVAAGLWLFAFFASFNIVHVSRCCIYRQEQPLFSILALGGFLLMAVQFASAVIGSLPPLEETRFGSSSTPSSPTQRPPREDRRRQPPEDDQQ